jgi:hypothetical protein
MKHAVRAVIAIALGAGLAAAAQAQSASQPSNPIPGNQVQSTAPSNTTPSSAAQSTATGKDMQSPAPQKKQRHAKAKMHSKGQMNIRQVQLRLKSEGLFKGKVTGKMDRQTRLALTKFEKQNGMPKTASLVRVNKVLASQTAGSGSSMQRMQTARLGKQQQIRTAHLGKQQQIRTAHMMRHPAKSQTTGVGSSMPTKNANAPQTNPAPAGAGGTTSPTPSNAPATSTPPSGTPANK